MWIASSRGALCVALSVLLAAGAPAGHAASRGKKERSRSAAVAALGGLEVAVEESWLRRPASLGIENAYRDLLARWAGGSLEAAREYARHQALVTERIAGARIRLRTYEYEEVQRSLRCLEAVEQNTAELLAARDPQLFLALSAFHLSAYSYLVEHPGLHWLAQQHWERLEWLRGEYRGRSSAPPAGDETRLAELQVAIGAVLQSLGLIGQLEKARESFRLAVRFGPDQSVARYWLGFLNEKLGFYKRAEQSFEWLRNQDSDDSEADLRLALVRARLGRTQEARVALERLGRGGAPDWIRVVAAQELARLEAAVDRESAVDRLRRLHEQFPGDGSVAILLASLSDDEFDDRHALLASLTRGEATGAPSPRLLYEEARTDDLEIEVEKFENWLVRKLPGLARAIEQVEHLETVQGALRGEGATALRTGFENPNRQRPVFSDCASFKMPKR